MAVGKKTGGRVKGTLNKATAEIKSIAQRHGPAAIKELARLMMEAESEQAKVAAIKELLDRAYGKAPQAIIGDPDAPVRTILEVAWAGMSGSSASE